MAQGIVAMLLVSLDYFLPVWGLILQCVTLMMYALSGALTGYGSYITRNNRICNNKYTGAEEDSDCYNIRLSAGWRCGIVAVAMCGVIVYVPGSLPWLIATDEVIWQIGANCVLDAMGCCLVEGPQGKSINICLVIPSLYQYPLHNAFLCPICSHAHSTLNTTLSSDIYVSRASTVRSNSPKNGGVSGCG
jgi:hypothetical protein